MNKYEIGDTIVIPQLKFSGEPDSEEKYGIISDFEFKDGNGWYGYYYKIYDCELKKVCHIICEDSIQLVK